MCQGFLRAHMPACLKHASFSFLRAKVPNACQLFNLACQPAKALLIIQLSVPQRPKGVPIFQIRLPKGVPIFQLFFKRIFDFEFFNYAEHLEVSRIFWQCRKFISRNKEIKL